uniref:Uncharacterized protein n=1 Tax=Setaria italica TaxID=4555 RepID=K4AHA4_SETIT
MLSTNIKASRERHFLSKKERRSISWSSYVMIFHIFTENFRHFDQNLCRRFSNLVLGCPLYCLETCTKCLSNTLESNCPRLLTDIRMI